MIAVIFEVWPAENERETYLDIAGELRPLLDDIDGFISIERFQSISDPDKLVSLSFWRDEAAVAKWRELEEHRHAQAVGRHHVFRNYRLRIAQVQRDYGMNDREQAPADSRSRNDGIRSVLGENQEFTNPHSTKAQPVSRTPVLRHPYPAG